MSNEGCFQDELDLFSPPVYQTAVEEGSWDKIAPLPGYNSNTVEFHYSGTDEYPDLEQTYLYLKVSIRKRTATQTDQNATPITENDKIAPVNNFMHSIFRSATLYINNTAIENTNDMYAYRAYIENLLSFSKSAKDTHLNNCLFIKDTPGSMNYVEPQHFSLTETSSTADVVKHLKSVNESGANEGLFERKKRFNNDSVELWGPVQIDMFNTNRYLLNNVSFRLVLTRNSDAFCLMGERGTNVFVVYIENAHQALLQVT